MPASNAGEQFLHFISLVSWLLSINNHQVEGWNKYDDPTTASQNVLIELKKLGIELPISPGKLKNGHGEEVCQVLKALTEMSLKNRFKFKRHAIKDDANGQDDEADEMDGDDLDGRADMADEVHADIEEDEIDEDMDFGVGGGIQYDMAKHMEADMAANAIIHSAITTEKWQIEVERVTHKLKFNKNAQDENAWRSHLDQTKKYADQVKAALPEVRVKLERLQEEASKALDKISRKEALLSRSFQGQTGDYRAHSDKIKENQDSFSTVSKNVEDLETELSEINSRLDNASRKIEDTGKQFSDNTPVQNIKKAITTIKTDISSIDIRIGVVSNTLLQLKLKEKSKVLEDGKQLEILDNEYEVEI